ncbi:hypothetical protein BSKO_02998 [Bryopsis sp. KO-2023]|nr:hypothetical protein BSKO_02998 [Bryopsis sp. KO-2023]
MEPLFSLLEEGPEREVSQFALGCLVNLHSTNPQNQRAMLDKGIIPKLEKFLSFRSDSVATYRARTLLTSLCTSETPINKDDDSTCILDLMLADGVQDKTQTVEWLNRWLKSEQAKLSIAK